MTKINKGDILTLIEEIETIASISIKNWRHELKHSVEKDHMKTRSPTMKTSRWRKKTRQEQWTENGNDSTQGRFSSHV